MNRRMLKAEYLDEVFDDRRNRFVLIDHQILAVSGCPAYGLERNVGLRLHNMVHSSHESQSKFFALLGDLVG